ncbi:DegQ family serine endoprotease [Pelagibius litoralis]|uniref:Probable periplasmic serine endoprotease DegP-like n=1 Tax=Pelagibius litoralis TaxID=374515 RepID=A0A967EXC6_9PROT|nr:DegQ family serine endoprotease [Pelagibius litoralis]NIA68855.1 DegQ family serine endoprotease [Pelagibius litoralis]
MASVVTLNTRFSRETAVPASSGRRPFPLTLLAAAGLSVALIAGSVAPVAARPAPASFADLVEDVAPAVVNIAVVQRGAEPSQSRRSEGPPQVQPFGDDPNLQEFFERFFGPGGRPDGRQAQPERPRQGAGSGFVIDPEGYVVTNNHVIDGADEITVTLKDGTAYEARLIGADPRTDLAVLKIEADGPLPFVEFGESDGLRPGDWVVAVGNPFGLGGSVTAGIVSARGRDLPGGSLIDFIQIDAPINRGNSGGPTFDSEGAVIGVNTAIYSPNGGSVGIGFAIPSNLASRIVDDLRDDGKVDRGWLGVRIQPVTPDIAEGFGMAGVEGALVAAVEPGSPAAAAGLRAGDVVLEWDGKPVVRVKDLSQLVAQTPVDKPAELRVWRDRGPLALTVVTGAVPTEQQVSGLPAPQSGEAQKPGKTELGETGVTVAALDDEAREALGLNGADSGVVIVDIAPGSHAARSGLRPGDLIRSITLEPVKTPDEAVARIAALEEAGESVATIKAVRQGTESFFALRLTKI